jgi:putative endonuclease
MGAEPGPARAPAARAAGGAEAEAIAADFLAARGLRIVARNVRFRVGEIDLVAKDGDTLVFVEVRLRRSQRYGGAAASITPAKRARLLRAVRGYLAGMRSFPNCRVDAILLDRLDRSSIEWLRDIAGE